MKLCECGCGQSTGIATYNDKRRGVLKGQPNRFVQGHTSRRHPKLEVPPQPKLCECGCGQPAPLASQTSTRFGWTQGQPMRFVLGHNNTVRHKATLEESFMKHFVRGEAGQCWEWQGSRANTGYGRVSVAGGRMLAHRASYLIHYGDLPDDMEVCHSCDNRPCVNPEHLFLGTHQDNMTDASKKGRTHPGEQTKGAKLNDEAVRQIREAYRNGALQRELAEEYGVASSAISMIVNHNTWKHVE